MYKFIKTRNDESRHDHSYIEHQFLDDDATYHDILQAFEDFLKGCGFSFKGSLQIVEDEE